MAKSIIGKLVNISGSKLVLEVNGEIDTSSFSKLSNGHKPQIELLINDGRTITIDQRKKIYALFGDMSNYTGYFKYECKYILKSAFIEKMKHPKNFSLGSCSVTTANEFMKFVIDFLIIHDIPFKTQVFDEIQSDYGLVRRCVEKRECIICGKPHADIDHFKAVGMGRNRRKINQVGMEAWSLCRIHHTERHKIGIIEFAKKYKIKPIKLDEFLIKKLNLSNKGAIDNDKAKSK